MKGEFWSVCFWLLVSRLERGELVSSTEYHLPYNSEKECRNAKREYYDQDVKKCCSKCPPGAHLSAACTETSDTQCIACKENTYTEIWHWKDRCFSCKKPCSSESGFVEIKPCNSTQNRYCQCQPGMSCTSQRCDTCEKHIVCPRGSGVFKPGNVTSNTKCSPCITGTFSDEESATAPCKTHMNCVSLGKKVLLPGNSTHDSVCGKKFTTTQRSIPATRLSVSSTRAPANNNVENMTESYTIVTVPEKQDPSGVYSNVAEQSIVLFKNFCLQSAVELDTIGSHAEKVSDGQQRGSLISSSKNNKQEVEWLLESPGSSSSSLDAPSSSEHERRMENCIGAARSETSRQQKACNSRGCMPEHKEFPTSPGSNGYRNTHVNVTCIVNVCNSEYNPDATVHSSHTDGPERSENQQSSADMEDVPFSQEENSVNKAGLSVEAEDHFDKGSPLQEEGKEFHLGIQDTGMKMT
uniref:TNF receptor superfamily member 1B n=1 Tax=Latimeria chalumnae TaxID=7897 RepID=M3XKX5_LATCH|nr:PREDICTED: tumor necrosis factor receptor superfamily member 1B [Latimeria chalumnae]|eukprot:XP_005996655.1 PREDICTED: tumor necrosis factor receptor superfamily member 1B [Latimeria chalumnae]